MEKDERIVVSRLQVEVVKLRAKGYSLYDIARELKTHPSTVHRALKSFEETFPKLRMLYKEVQKTRYFTRNFSKSETLKSAIESRLRRVSRGLYYGGGPFGYKSKNGELVVNPDEAKIVQKIFADYKNGKSMKKIGEEVGMRRAQVRRIIRNPAYIGKIRFKGQIYPGKHEPIVDEALWKSVQPLMGPRPPPRPSPTGYKWEGGRLVVDSSTAEKVRSVFKLRLGGMHYAEISRRTGINAATVSFILKNPIYAGRVKVDGRLVDSGSEAIVDYETWSRVQKVHTPRMKTLVEMRRKKGIETRSKILGALPGTAAQIVERSGLRIDTVYSWLGQLTREGVVEREGKRYGTYRFTEHFAKSVGISTRGQ